VKKSLAWVVNSSSFGRVFPEHLRRLESLCQVKRIDDASAWDGRKIARTCRGATVLIASVSPVYGDSFFRNMPGLKLLARHGIGYDNVDLASATRHGVVVTRVPGYVEREGMAESAVMLALSIARRTRAADMAVRNGKWNERTRFVGIELRGRPVGVIGCGNIGSRVVQLFRRGFGARVMATDPNVADAKIRSYGAQPVSLGKLLRESSVITLHASLNPTSRGIIGKSALQKMRPGTLLVNNARGELLDEGAVARALHAGRLAGLAVDVVSCEPASKSHPFLKCPNTIVVPHVGAYTVESLRAMGEKMVEDVASILGGRRPREVVNPQVFASAQGKRN